MIAASSIIYPNVIMGNNVTIEEFCIIGYEYNGYNGEETIIGDNAIIRAGTYIYAGNLIGNNFQTGNKVNIRELNKIGDDVSIGTLSVVEHHIKIGCRTRLHSQVFVPEYTEIDDDVWIGPNVVITNAKYPKHPDVKSSLLGAHINSNSKIGANSTLLPGVVIGANSLIGAGSVVTADVMADDVVYGNPSKSNGKITY